MKTKFFEFDPVIYPFPLLVCRYIKGVTAKEICEKFNAIVDKRTAQVIDEEDLLSTPTLTAKTLCVLDKQTEQMYYLVIMYRPKLMRYGIVSHEALHVVTMICDWLGIAPPTPANDEPHAYLEQWISNCIGSVLDGRPDMMKGKLYKFEDDATEKN